MVLAPGLLSWPRSDEAIGHETPRMLGALTFVSAITALVSAQTVWANWDRASWTEARPVSLPVVLVTVGIALLLGVVVDRLARRSFGAGATAVPTASDLVPMARSASAAAAGPFVRDS